ncbi:MAG: response regulator [Gemmatimonadetes bacterium]|jgi:CheY-like chemotaxis protein|nr:response regulator [Gemmatimonadota bacterium]
MMSSHTPTPEPPARILVVDDTPENIDVLIDMLSGEAFEVMVATSGAQALEVVAAHRPDLMLLDVRMPGMDGFETYRRLRTMEEMDSLPVLFVTAEGDAEMAAQESALGGIDYVTKPFLKEVLLALIRSHLRR